MSSKIIIIATIILLIVSFSFLFVVEVKNHDYDYNKSWSAVYFNSPGDNSLDFTIENHEGKQMKYGYKISVAGKVSVQDNVDIDAGQQQKIIPVIGEEDISSKNILIEVSANDLKYRIYKDIK